MGEYKVDQDHRIKLSDAKIFTRNYRQSIEITDCKGGFFSATAIRDLLAQPNCVGIRYYYGIDIYSDKKVLIIVGVDENGKDIYNGEQLKVSVPSVEICDENSQLNG
jgi:hypothetical protein